MSLKNRKKRLERLFLALLLLSFSGCGEMSLQFGTNGPTSLSTNFGGNGDENLLAPHGYSQIFNLEQSFQSHSFQDSCQRSGTTGSEDTLHRLSKNEYQNTIKSILERFLGQSTAQSIFATLNQSLRTLPEDRVEAKRVSALSNSDSVINDAHLKAYFDIAQSLAAQLESKKVQIFGSCASSMNTQCLNSFLTSKGHIFHRRPLTTEDIQSYDGMISEGGIKTVLAALFMSPHFLFHMTYGNGENKDDFSLNSWELASKLSYALWASPPDDELYEAARNGSIVTEEIYAQQSERLFDDAKGRDHLKHFVREWLHLDETPAIDISAQKTKLLWENLDGAPQSIDASKVRTEAIEEIEDLVSYYVYDAPESSRRLSGLALSRLSNAKPELTDAIYQSSLPRNLDQTSAGQNWFEFEDLDRKGLISRAAFQVIDGVGRRPIIKGVKVLDRLLCRAISVPADNAAPPQAILRDDFSTRERVTAITEIPNTSCVGCHATINPIGFVFEAFDPFGRKNITEGIFEPGQNNPSDFIATPLVETRSETRFNNTSVPIADPGDFSQAMAESFELHGCFSRFWWRNINKRAENLQSDSCHIESIYKNLESNDKGLPIAMLEAVRHTNFKRRVRQYQ